MKNYKKIILVFLLLLVISFFTDIKGKDIKAENLNSNIYTYKWKEDNLISGNSEVTKNFYVSENMELMDFSISLKLDYSQTLIKDLSSISIEINNSRIYSIKINDLNNDRLININIPNDLINKGINTITINGFLKSTTEKCEINNDINWVIIDKDSYFSFKCNRKESKSIGEVFDSTYYSDGENAEVNIALPENLSSFNYSQIASISSLIGFINKNKEVDVEVKTLSYSDLLKSDKENIVIGTCNDIKSFNEGLFTVEEWKTIEEKGCIAIRKIGNKNQFIFITQNENQLETLCRILKNKTLLSQMILDNIENPNEKEYTFYVLDEKKIINEKEFSKEVTLKDLGYEDYYGEGNGVKTFNYYFTIPANKKLTNNNKVTFVYNYSSLIDYDNAYLTVEINNETLISKKLENYVGDVLLNDSKEILSNEETLSFIIPEKYFDYDSFNISLKFNLKPTAENCEAQSYSNMWIKVNSDNSKLNLDLVDREDYKLPNSQGLFQDYNGNVDGNILVDSYKNLTINSITKLSSYLGKVSKGVNKLLIYSIESKDSEYIDISSNNIIFTLSNSLLINEINSELKIPVSENNEFINRDLFIQNTPTLGAIELTLSGNKLIFIGNDKEQLNNAILNY